MRITLVITTLGAGGAERVLSTMANYWAQRAREVTLITFSTPTTDFYPLAPEVRRIGLDMMTQSARPTSALLHNVRRVRRLRRVLRDSRPDVIVSFIDKTNVLVLLAGRGLRIPILVSERIDPRYHPIGRLWATLRRLMYPTAQALVVQSEEVRSWARTFLRAEKVHLIPNSASAPDSSREAEQVPTLPRPLIVAMGRLDPQKGFDLLLDAFAHVASKHANWSLAILGDGEERERLEALADTLNLTRRIRFCGRIQDPARMLRCADLFVLSSRYEGFPNALLEAMACGLPVISFDCPSGPRDIIRNEVDGLLVPPMDVAGLAVAMDRLMSDASERACLATRAGDVLERFHPDRIMARWEALFQQVMNRGEHGEDTFRQG